LKDLNSDEFVRRVLEATSQTPTSIYSPREDTLLMLDEITQLDFEGKSVLDLGTGSGILGLYCALRGAHVTVADIDEKAVHHATEAGKRLGVELHGVTSDLFSNLPDTFDWILFNPPYLPSEGINDRTVDGGHKGRMVIDRFLEGLPDHLSENGTAFLLVSSLNEPASLMAAHHEIDFSTLASRGLFFEELQVLRARLRHDFSR
jgi:release factor glutamine methyltransferase